MNWVAWVAIIGAAAWFPQLAAILYYKFVRPKLRFTPNDIVEVGYSMYGPILNLTYAISTSRKDALIEKITLDVKHEAGEKYEFQWKFLDEKGFETTTSSGDRMEARKSQAAIAIKVNIIGLVEKTIGFRDVSFSQKKQELNNDLDRKISHLLKTDPQNFSNLIFKTQEFLSLSDFIAASFYWKEGEYTVKLSAYTVRKKEPHTQEFIFRLNKVQVDTLTKNINITQDFLGNKILFDAKISPEIPLYAWKWEYPTFLKKES